MSQENRIEELIKPPDIEREMGRYMEQIRDLARQASSLSHRARHSVGPDESRYDPDVARVRALADLLEAAEFVVRGDVRQSRVLIEKARHQAEGWDSSDRAVRGRSSQDGKRKK